jgi:hypothetical protein
MSSNFSYISNPPVSFTLNQYSGSLGGRYRRPCLRVRLQELRGERATNARTTSSAHHLRALRRERGRRRL